ncbi:hypothetical protein TRFO_13739 [Tritrichomonas foetus]|uniref:Conserved oligomeric Golgi complex subunit 1 n=1 Tax=Tritrichomonas foetus TaxID=1144522 RepID=A0A1J4KXB4_9EUKA|nr:hypothetical protein TRFO_13739 [Tritrichomonas foetus]|eukprot:OHT15891.1 hypothetical protein TRFO_13739 [Tritrichomonas foetus]
MTEVLNISVTSDARDLFLEHDITTIKKIKSTALKEIEHKQNVLRQFIGDNYRPLLDTPPVLKEIQGIFETSQNALKQMDSFSRTITSASIQKSQATTPFAAVSQLYLESLNTLSSNEFSAALKSSLKAAEILNDYYSKNSENSLNLSLYSSLKFSIDALPSRIFASIQVFLTSHDSNLTSNSLIDCYEASMKLLTQFPNLKTLKSRTASQFIDNSLIKRVESLVYSASQIPDVCLLFMSLIEAVLTFLVQTKSPGLIFDHLLTTFRESFEKYLDHFSNFELREILRYAKTIEDANRNRCSAPQFVSAMSELSLSKIDFNVTFLEVFKNLAAQSIRLSVENLNLKDEINKILSDSSVEDFDAANFALNSPNNLSLCSLGVSPIITDFKKRLDAPILLIVSQLQSQITQIASNEMLQEPLKKVFLESSLILREAVQQKPLSVCLIINTLCSLSLVAQLSDSVAYLLTLQNDAAKEWARRISHESKTLLNELPKPGSAFNFLIFLERSIMKASGHVSHHPLDVNLRNEARRVVIEYFTEELKKMEFKSTDIEARKQTEAKAALYFQDYILIAQVLAITGNNELRALFIQKMSPVEFNDIENKANKKVDEILCQSGELLKLIGGGLQTRQPKSIDIDVNAALERFFPRMT